MTPSDAAALAWKNLAPRIAVQGVTIQSPPVVNFTLTDQNSNPIVGLENDITLYNATTGNTRASVPYNQNLYFVLAKLVPGTGHAPDKWVNMRTFKPLTNAQAAGTYTGADLCISASESPDGKAWCGTYPSADNDGTLVGDGKGGYTYTFRLDVTKSAAIVAAMAQATNPASTVDGHANGASADGLTRAADMGDLSYDPNATYRLAIMFYGNEPGTGSVTPTGAASSAAAVPMNVNTTGMYTYDFVPSGGKVAKARNIVDIDSCASCHDGKALAHGSRRDPNVCVTCHTDQVKTTFYYLSTLAGGTNGEAPREVDGITFKAVTGTTPQKRSMQAVVNGRAVGNFPNMIHKIHMGEGLVLQNYNFNNAGEGQFNAFGYPEDQRNCTKCHSGQTKDNSLKAVKTTDGDNWMKVPSRLACGSCHDGINFADASGSRLPLQGNNAANRNRVFVATGGHAAGTGLSDDSQCSSCHTPDMIALQHRTEVSTPNNPDIRAGSTKIEYELKSVTVDAGTHKPTFKFAITMDGAKVTTLADSTASPIAGYTNGPSFTVAYALPEDGIATPADFNSTPWSATGSSIATVKLTELVPAAGGTKGALSSLAADGSGYYTATLNTVIVPSTSTVKIARGVMYGYYYKYPVDTQNAAVSYNSPGMRIPVPASMVVVTGYSDRRKVVDAAKCGSCHEQLGVQPTIHSTDRTDPNQCAICHNPNLTNVGWSGNMSTFIHAIHGGDKRKATYGFKDVGSVGYPGILQDCNQCHLPNTVNFGANASAVSNLLWTTAAGTFSAGAYLPKDGDGNALATAGTAYGVGFAADISAGTTTPADATTLVSSPIAAACFSCHDSKLAFDHMTGNGAVANTGGHLYEARSTAMAGGTTSEQCLFCHGQGKEQDAAVVHHK
ncbi:MAG: OmcA/MtrC family decaheme c-type cytochrome [Gallionellaceae bacterium]|nr:OmcA/MtrC family decaheme c-type cytochrome [Gallionellaceae bacterium]